ncbi:MAG: DUF192 domain-containing protein [Candidatus Pacebacteria bacterium]|nr:DUF192 domain-containing protein [Candidatus Paceibacterota bacterium]
MRKTLTILCILLALGAFVTILDLIRTKGATDSPAKTVTIDIDGFSLLTEIVDTPESRSRGLSGREGLADDAGMLFVFNEPGIFGFWMKDMLFSIDMAWLNEDFCIIYLARNVSPDTYPTVFAPSVPALYVIEAKAGFFGSHNLKKGSCLEKPLL